MEVQELKDAENALVEQRLALEQTEAYQNFVVLEAKVSELRKALKQHMQERLEESGEKTFENELFKATLVERRNFKPDGDIPEGFEKVSLDTTKVGQHLDLYGELPEGVKITTTKYIKWSDKNE